MNKISRTKKFDVFNIDYDLLALVMKSRHNGDLPKKPKHLSIKTTYPPCTR
jgi:hypothetical protein